MILLTTIDSYSPILSIKSNSPQLQLMQDMVHTCGIQICTASSKTSLTNYHEIWWNWCIPLCRPEAEAAVSTRVGETAFLRRDT